MGKDAFRITTVNELRHEKNLFYVLSKELEAGHTVLNPDLFGVSLGVKLPRLHNISWADESIISKHAGIYY